MHVPGLRGRQNNQEASRCSDRSSDCHSLQVFRFVFHSPRRGSPLATALRSGAGNLKLAKVLRFRQCQHGGTYEVRPAFDAVLPVADSCSRPECDQSNPYDSRPPVTGKRAVLGRFMGGGVDGSSNANSHIILLAVPGAIGPGASGAIGRWKALGTRVRRNGLGKQRGRNHQITPARRRPRPERMPRSRLW